MDRRELLKMIAALTGGVVIGGDVFLSGCTTGAKTDAGFSASHITLLDEVGETIIPATSTPGAKAAQIGEFMKTIVTDCYTEKEQAAFTQGIQTLETACKKMHNHKFMDCDQQQRHDLLISLEKEASDYNKKRDEEEKPQREAAKTENKSFEGSPSHYYTMMKQLTLWGYFTSKPGVTQQLRYVPVPQKYDGDFPYKKGDKAFG